MGSQPATSRRCCASSIRRAPLRCAAHVCRLALARGRRAPAPAPVARNVGGRGESLDLAGRGRHADTQRARTRPCGWRAWLGMARRREGHGQSKGAARVGTARSATLREAPRARCARRRARRGGRHRTRDPCRPRVPARGVCHRNRCCWRAAPTRSLRRWRGRTRARVPPRRRALAPIDPRPRRLSRAWCPRRTRAASFGRRGCCRGGELCFAARESAADRLFPACPRAWDATDSFTGGSGLARGGVGAGLARGGRHPKVARAKVRRLTWRVRRVYTVPWLSFGERSARPAIWS
jgi:hypothetical protein